MSNTAGGELASVPARAIPRLLSTFEQFLQSIREAIEASPTSEAAERGRWMRTHQSLQQDYRTLQGEARQAEAGDQKPLVRHAGRLRFLARRMDGSRLGFAGPAFEKRLTETRRLLVLASWQIHAAAHGSRATGL